MLLVARGGGDRSCYNTSTLNSFNLYAVAGKGVPAEIAFLVSSVQHIEMIPERCFSLFSRGTRVLFFLFCAPILDYCRRRTCFPTKVFVAHQPQLVRHSSAITVQPVMRSHGVSDTFGFRFGAPVRTHFWRSRAGSPAHWSAFA